MGFKRFGPGDWFGGGYVFSGPRRMGMRAYNSTGSTIAANKLVAVIGYDATVALPKIVLADADVAGHDDVWVSDTAIPTGSVGFVYKAFVTDASLNTDAVSAAGDPIYLSATAGGFTATAPTAADAIVLPVGWVLVKSATVGVVHWDIGPIRKASSNQIQTPTGAESSQTKASTASFDVDSGTTGSTLTNITGLTAISLVAGATYKFKVKVSAVVMTTNGGLKMAFKLTTATLTAINARVRQSTDTDNADAISTTFVTTTDQATWFDQKAVVYTNCEIEGTLVVGTAGTIAVQAAQNTAHADNTTILAGAAMAEFVRIS